MSNFDLNFIDFRAKIASPCCCRLCEVFSSRFPWSRRNLRTTRQRRAWNATRSTVRGRLSLGDTRTQTRRQIVFSRRFEVCCCCCFCCCSFIVAKHQTGLVDLFSVHNCTRANQHTVIVFVDITIVSADTWSTNQWPVSLYFRGTSLFWADPSFFWTGIHLKFVKTGDKFEAYQPNRETVFWFLRLFWRPLGGYYCFFLTELSILNFSQQCTFLLTWSVLPQMSWEWNPQAPPLFNGTRWAWDPWGPLQTPWEILWPLLYQPITIPYCDRTLLWQKQFLNFHVNKTHVVGAVSIYLFFTSQIMKETSYYIHQSSIKISRETLSL